MLKLTAALFVQVVSVLVTLANRVIGAGPKENEFGAGTGIVKAASENQATERLAAPPVTRY